MNLREKYTLEIQSIWQDIEALKKGQIYEIDSVPGVPQCSTIGRRLEERFTALLAKIELDAEGDIETVAEIVQNME